MKVLFLLALAAAETFSQEQSRTTYTRDVNGRPVAGATLTESKAPGESARRQTVQNVNGRRVPIEEVEERVVSDDGRTRVTERTVRRYDANGRPGPPERIRTEQTKTAEGSRTAVTVQRADINGNLQPAERSVTETRTSGSVTTASTVTERPTANGAFEIVQRAERVVREPQAGSSSESLTVLERDANGRFQEASRATVERTTTNGSTVENSATYVRASTGEMQLLRQAVTRALKTPGGERLETDVYEPELAGRAGGGSQPQPKLREQRIVDRSGNTETVSVRRALPSDPNRLGALLVVEETVCSGPCATPAAPAK